MVAALEKEQRLAELRSLIRNREELRATFDEILNEETERSKRSADFGDRSHLSDNA